MRQPSTGEATVDFVFSCVRGNENIILTLTEQNEWSQEIRSIEALPDAVNDKYLHTNAGTGETEWADIPEKKSAVIIPALSSELSQEDMRQAYEGVKEALSGNLPLFLALDDFGLMPAIAYLCQESSDGSATFAVAWCYYGVYHNVRTMLRDSTGFFTLEGSIDSMYPAFLMQPQEGKYLKGAADGMLEWADPFAAMKTNVERLAATIGEATGKTIGVSWEGEQANFTIE